MGSEMCIRDSMILNILQNGSGVSRCSHPILGIKNITTGRKLAVVEHKSAIMMMVRRTPVSRPQGTEATSTLIIRATVADKKGISHPIAPRRTLFLGTNGSRNVLSAN